MTTAPSRASERLRLPPRLVHELRTRSFARLSRMAGAPGKRGFSLALYRRIAEEVAGDRLPIERAIAVTYLCSYLVDHVVLAQEEAEQTIEGRGFTSEERRRVWETSYDHAIARIIRTLPGGEGLQRDLDRLEHYTRLPGSIHRHRAHHWRWIWRFISNGRSEGPDASTEMYLQRKIGAILESPRAPRAKARAVCLAVSLLADLSSARQGTAWAGEYVRIMIDLYARLVEYPQVLREIVHMT